MKTTPNANLFGVSTAKETLLHAFQVESMGKEGGREGGREEGGEGGKRERGEREEKKASNAHVLLFCIEYVRPVLQLATVGMVLPY